MEDHVLESTNSNGYAYFAVETWFTENGIHRLLFPELCNQEQ